MHYSEYVTVLKKIIMLYMQTAFNIILTLCLPIKTKVPYANSLDPDETPRYSRSHPDPSCLHMALWLLLAGIGLIIRMRPGVTRRLIRILIA